MQLHFNFLGKKNCVCIKAQNCKIGLLSEIMGFLTTTYNCLCSNLVIMGKCSTKGLLDSNISGEGMLGQDLSLVFSYSLAALLPHTATLPPLQPFTSIQLIDTCNPTLRGRSRIPVQKNEILY